MLLAAALGFCSIGIELVPVRHELAIAARELLKPAAARKRCKLICGDALSLHLYLEEARLIFCNNRAGDYSLWPNRLNARLVAHIAAHAPSLIAFACTAELPARAVRAAGWVLVRGTQS